MAKNQQHEEWKKKIMAVNDRKLLEYMQDQIRIRLDIARADHNMMKPESNKKSDTMPTPYDSPPRKLAPIKMVAKSDNDGDESNQEEQYY